MTDQILAAVLKHPFVEGLTPEHCATLASLARPVSFAQGDMIFREGDARHEFFLLLNGRVALEMMARATALPSYPDQWDAWRRHDGGSGIPIRSSISSNVAWASSRSTSHSQRHSALYFPE